MTGDTSHPLSYFIHLPMKMELIEGSETSAISTMTPGNYPKENILQKLSDSPLQLWAHNKITPYGVSDL